MFIKWKYTKLGLRYQKYKAVGLGPTLVISSPIILSTNTL